MTESIQKQLLRVRPPRVRITYDVETGGAIEKLELPFIVGILADLQGDRKDDAEPTALSDRRMLDIDRDSFDDVMNGIGPGVQLDTRAAGLEQLKPSSDPLDSYLRFSALGDFEPLKIVQSMPTLRELYQARQQIRWLQAKAESSGPVSDQLERWLKFDVAKDDSQIPDVRDALPKVFGTPAPDRDAIVALRATLPGLYDKVQAYLTAQIGLDSATDQDAAKAALAADKEAALGALAACGLQPDSDAALGKMAATEDEILQWGQRLVDALALPANPDNDKKAANLVKLLLETPVENPVADSDIQRNALRNQTMVNLGLKDHDAAVAAITPLKQAMEARDKQSREQALNKARFLAGLQEPVGSNAVPPCPHPEIDAYFQLYLKDCAEADGRKIYYQVLHYLTGGDAAPKVGRELFHLVELLRPANQVTVPAILQRLSYFVQQIFLPWNQQDPFLLQGKQQGVCAVIDQRVAQIDQLLSTTLSAIMHAPTFRRLEASWRGLHYLVFNSETNDMLQLKVFNATQDELRKDMESAVEFDQSALFKKIYEAEYGTLGGLPYSLLVGDYQISSAGEDIDFLKKMAEVAAAAHAPFIAAADPDLFGLTDFSSLAMPRDLGKIFESQDLESWREFRAMEDSRYVTLVLPRTLLRLPYGKPDQRNTTPCDGLNFEERVADDPTVFAPDKTTPLSYPRPDTEQFLWGNAAYVLAERITNAFTLYGWTAAIRGVEGGGLVENLPLYSYLSDAGTQELFCPTEVTITDRREKELSDLGFMALCHYKGTSTAAFFGGQTTNSPKTYFSPDANANAKLSSMLPYILAASRFAHYIKVIMRKKIGLFMTRANVESYLNNWIAHYVLLDDNAPQEAKAAFPLRAASVVVTETAGSPGTYNATVFLKPHFQLEELSTSIRLVATLPGG